MALPRPTPKAPARAPAKAAPVKAAPAKQPRAKAAPDDAPKAKKSFPKIQGKPKPKFKVSTQEAPLYEVPEGFKPFVMEVTFGIDALSEITRLNSIVRCRSKWSPDMPDEDRYNMREYDQPTVEAVTAKIASRIFASSAKRRLKPGSRYRVIFRIGETTAYGDAQGGDPYKALTASVQGAYVILGSGNRQRDEALAKDDVEYRKIRTIIKSLPPAFVRCVLPPALERKSKRNRDSEE